MPFGTLRGIGGGMMEVRVRRERDATRSSLHELADAVEFKYLIMDNPANETPPSPDRTEGPSKPGNGVPTPDDCPNAVTSKTALWRINLGTVNQGKRVIGFMRLVNLSNPANNSGWRDLMTTIIT